ncbi:MAG: hypothetical protein QXI12_09595 [Candidatus Methanomethyliaceae archaeon]
MFLAKSNEVLSRAGERSCGTCSYHHITSVRCEVYLTKIPYRASRRPHNYLISRILEPPFCTGDTAWFWLLGSSFGYLCYGPALDQNDFSRIYGERCWDTWCRVLPVFAVPYVQEYVYAQEYGPSLQGSCPQH